MYVQDLIQKFTCLSDPRDDLSGMDVARKVVLF